MNQFDEVVARLGSYSTQWDYIEDRFGQKDLLPFSISDMDFQIPAGTRAVLASCCERGLFGYTRWNHHAYKGSIQRWFAENFGTVFAEEAVVYSPSVIYSLSVLVQLLSAPQDKVVTLTPCYDAFFALIKNNERELVGCALKKSDDGFVIDFTALTELFQTVKPKIFLLCNPHNPTGKALSENELKEIIALCNQYHVAILSDEIHMDVRRAGVEHRPLLQFADLIEVPYATLSSASKTFNTPGIGGSYGIIPEATLRAKFLAQLKGRDGLSSISYLALLALMDCYDNQKPWLAELNAYVDENFRVFKALVEQVPGVKFTIPDATYLGWVDVSALHQSQAALQAALLQEKVAIMPGETYGTAGQGYLRFNLGAPRSKICEGAARLVAALKSLA